MMSLEQLFCHVDDFMIVLQYALKQHTLPPQNGKRGPKAKMSASEIMTIIIWFHQSHYRNFKNYYLKHVCVHLRSEFPNLVSYNRFVELTGEALPFLCLYMKTRLGQCTGISFIDSTRLPVCHNKRIFTHKVFDGYAARGKSSMGWFFGFKLHVRLVFEHEDNAIHGLLVWFLIEINAEIIVGVDRIHQLGDAICLSDDFLVVSEFGITVELIAVDG